MTLTFTEETDMHALWEQWCLRALQHALDPYSATQGGQLLSPTATNDDSARKLRAAFECWARAHAAYLESRERFMVKDSPTIDPLTDPVKYAAAQKAWRTPSVQEGRAEYDSRNKP